MCDYCGCRSIGTIADLAAEHEAVLTLSSEIRSKLALGDTATARSQFKELLAVLAPHIAKEEQGIFAELRREGALGPYLDRLAGEHAALAASTAVLDELADSAWSDEVAALLDDLAAHIAIEEYDLFPASVVELAPGAWDRIARVFGSPCYPPVHEGAP